MHSTAAFLSMPNADGIVLGGTMGRGFNDNSARGYPAWLTLTTRQVTDVVMDDQEILSVKGGRQVSYLDDVTRSERIRQICASQVPLWVSRLQGHWSHWGELSSTHNATGSYITHCCHSRDLEQHPVCTWLRDTCCVDPRDARSRKLVSESGSLRALLQQAIAEPEWSTDGRIKLPAYKGTYSCMERCEGGPNQLHCGIGQQYHLPDEPCWGGSLEYAMRTHTMSKPYYRQGGLIPHLSKKGFFWKSTRPAVHETVLQRQLRLDHRSCALETGGEDIMWVDAHCAKDQWLQSYTGLHKSLAVDCV